MYSNRIKERIYRQKRAWKPRRDQEFQSWDMLLLSLTDAYLHWKYGGSSSTPREPNIPTSTSPNDVHAPSPPTVPSPPPSPRSSPRSSPHSSPHSSPRSSPHSSPHVLPSTIPTPPTDEVPPVVLNIEWELEVYDLFSLESTLKISRDPSSVSPALDFIRHGYITKTTKAPNVAVSLRTLELLYRLRQRRASFSVEAFAKVVCDYYQVSTTFPWTLIFLTFLRRFPIAHTFATYFRIRSRSTSALCAR